MFLLIPLYFQGRIRVSRTYATSAVANAKNINGNVISTNIAIPPFLGPGESPSVQGSLSLAN